MKYRLFRYCNDSIVYLVLVKMQCFKFVINFIILFSLPLCLSLCFSFFNCSTAFIKVGNASLNLSCYRFLLSSFVHFSKLSSWHSWVSRCLSSKLGEMESYSTKPKKKKVLSHMQSACDKVSFLNHLKSSFLKRGGFGSLLRNSFNQNK